MSAGTVDQVIANAVGVGATLTAAAAASCLPAAAKPTLRPNFFDAAGKMCRLTATGTISSAITTPGTARFDVRLGATPTIVVWDSLAILLDSVAARSDTAFWLEIVLTCRSVGAGVAATLIGVGKFTSQDILGVAATAPKGSVTAMLPWATAPAAGTGFNSLIANQMDLFFTQTAATGSMTVQQFVLEEMN